MGLRRGRLLVYLTVGGNVVEGVVAVGSGLVAGSAALVGFGVGSFIGSLSGGALLLRLRSDKDSERRELIALKLVGVSFPTLAACVTTTPRHHSSGVRLRRRAMTASR